MNILKVKELWNALSIPTNLAYRIVNERVFAELTGTAIENKYAVIEGIGKEVFAAVERRSNFEEFIDYMLDEYDVNRENLITDVYQFLNHSILVGIFKKDREGYCECEKQYEIKNEEDILQLMIKFYSEKALPFKVFLELTHKCNHKCKHCYLGKEVEMANERSQSGLSLHRILDLLEEMKKEGVLQLILTGGEALLYPSFEIVLEKAVKSHFAISLLTNASFLSEKIINFISSFPIDEIRIPLYGGESYHNWFVGESNSYEKVIWSLKQFKSRNVNVIPTTILTNKNVKDIVQQKSILQNIGFELEVSPLIFPTIYRDPTPTSFRIQNEQLFIFKQLGIDLQRNKCVAGISRFRITPSGEVNACEMLPFSFGNVMYNSFGGILKSPFREKWVYEFSKMIRQREKRCEGCKVYEHCIDCPGLSYLETGNIGGKSQEACRLAHFYKKGDI